MSEDDPLKHTPMCELDRDNRATKCPLCNDTGEQRYWEGRYRDEAKENERLKEALTNALLALDERNSDAEILARTYEKQIERLLKELERANCPVQERW